MAVFVSKLNLMQLSRRVALFALVAGGCAAQADPDYEGESLAIVRGKVSGELPTNAGRPVAALVWGNFRGELLPSSLRASVSGSFPSRFTMYVRDVPPEAVLTPGGAGESRLGFGYIAALSENASPSTQAEMTKAIVGGCADHFVLYADRDINPTSITAEFFHGPLKAGYHLMSARPYTSGEKEAIASCRARAEADGANGRASCLAFKMYVSEVDSGFAFDVTLKLAFYLNVDFPDLS